MSLHEALNMMKTKMFMQAMLISIAITISVIFNLLSAFVQTLTLRICVALPTNFSIAHRYRLSAVLQFGSGDKA